MESSLLFESLKTERYFSDDEIADKRKVKVYIRTVSRKSIKIELPSELQMSQLKEIIENKLNISMENQIIYLKGVCINFNIYVLLENSWIIHAINKAEVFLPQITIDIKTNVLKNNQQTSSKCTFDPKIKVKTFIQENILQNYQINLNQVLLIESGRILRQNLTFLEQNIQNGTTINLIHSFKDLTSSIKPQSLIIEQKENNQMYSTFSDSKSQEKSLSLSSLDKKMPSKNQKITKTKFCQIHQIKGETSNISESPLKSSRLKRKDSELSLKNSKPILIGERQCNCDKKEAKNSKEPKFITQIDKKRLSLEIRQQNLQKLLRNKQKKDEKQTESQIFANKGLKRMKSLQQFDYLPLSEKSKSLKLISNPQKFLAF